MEQQTVALEPAVVRGDEGEAWWWSSGLAVIKATAADTGGRMSIVEMVEPPGYEAPLHVHHTEDEVFWLLEGSATIEIGDQTVEARAGDYLFGPRDVPHRYTVGPDGCRFLFVLTPGGFEELVRALGRPAEERSLPPDGGPEPTPEEQARMQAAIRAHGCELLA